MLERKNTYDEDGESVCYLSLSDESDFVVSRYTGNGKKVWQTVTPCILPGYDDGDPRKCDRLIRRMFQQADYPQPIGIEIRPWGHSGLRPQEFFVPRRHDHHKYPRFFMKIEFLEPICGPVFAGKGRHYGMGLFVGEDNASGQVVSGVPGVLASYTDQQRTAYS